MENNLNVFCNNDIQRGLVDLYVEFWAKNTNIDYTSKNNSSAYTVTVKFLLNHLFVMIRSAFYPKAQNS